MCRGKKGIPSMSENEEIGKAMAERENNKSRMLLCPTCRHSVSEEADACPSCGHPFTPRGNVVVVAHVWNPVIAGLLSLFIPGLGQLYKGQIFRGIIWLCVVALAHLLFFWLWDIPGIIMHALCVLNAVFSGLSRRRVTLNGGYER